MINILEKIQIYCVAITCKVVTTTAFPNFPGIALRGGFGISLKNSVCVMKQLKNCSQCPLLKLCVYATVFETPAIQPIERMKKSTHFPHPFSIAPLFDYPAEFKTDDTFTFKLSLFGNSILYFPNILHALMILGQNGIGVKKGKFEIQRISDYATGEIIYDGDSLQLSDIKPYFIEAIDTNKNTLEITFLTPCRMKSNGKYLKHVDLKSIILNIKRKIENISYFFGSNPVTLDISSIDFNAIECRENSVQWEYTERYSKRKEQKMKMAGYKGRAVITGNIKQVYPLLKIGEAINIGSTTSFGFGAIKVM